MFDNVINYSLFFHQFSLMGSFEIFAKLKKKCNFIQKTKLFTAH